MPSQCSYIYTKGYNKGTRCETIAKSGWTSSIGLVCSKHKLLLVKKERKNK